jgi:hypothetical protein
LRELLEQDRTEKDRGEKSRQPLSEKKCGGHDAVRVDHATPVSIIGNFPGRRNANVRSCATRGWSNAPRDVSPVATTSDTSGNYTVSSWTIRLTTENSKAFVIFAPNRRERSYMAACKNRA